MNIESQLNREHAVKLAAHSRENEKPCICEDCELDPETCREDPGECEQAMYEEWAEDQYESLRGMYD